MAARRILVDLLGFTGSRGGTETYARELLPRLADRMRRARFAAITGRPGRTRVATFLPGQVQIVPWVGSDPVTWTLGAVAATDAVARRHGAEHMTVVHNGSSALPSSLRSVSLMTPIMARLARRP